MLIVTWRLSISSASVVQSWPAQVHRPSNGNGGLAVQDAHASATIKITALPMGKLFHRNDNGRLPVPDATKVAPMTAASVSDAARSQIIEGLVTEPTARRDITFPLDAVGWAGQYDDIKAAADQARAKVAAQNLNDFPKTVTSGLGIFFGTIDDMSKGLKYIGADGFAHTVGQISHSMRKYLDDIIKRWPHDPLHLPWTPSPAEPGRPPLPIPGGTPDAPPTNVPPDPTNGLPPDWPSGPEPGRGGFPPPQGPHKHDPLVIDLDGNGVQFLSLSASSAYFDLDQNGFAEHVGWVSPGDALLAVDWNGDGVINDGGELFGSALVSGHAALAAFDLNGDSRIDSADAIFSELRLWTDTNGNGVTDLGELHTLPELGISQIGLTATVLNTNLPLGSLIARSDVVRGGSAAAAYSVNFLVDTVYSHEVLPADFTFDSDVSMLPNLRGFGGLSDLDVAMTRDSTLKADVIAFVQGLSAMTYAQAVSAARDLLFHWAGVTNVDPQSRGGALDARAVSVVELITGIHYPEQLNATVGFGPGIEAYFETFFRGYLTRLVSQAWGSNMLIKEVDDPFAVVRQDVIYNPTILLAGGDLVDGERLFQNFSINVAGVGNDLVIGSHFLSGNELQVLIIPLLRDMITDKYGSLDAAQAGFVQDLYLGTLDNPLAFATGMEAVFGLPGPIGTDEADSLSLQQGSVVLAGAGDDSVQGSAGVDFIFGQDGADVVSGGDDKDLIVGGNGDDALAGGGGDDHLLGGSGTDILTGDEGDDLLSGGDGDDTLVGAGGNDSLLGGTGDDHLEGGAGNDTYVVDPDGGSDTIVDSFGSDLLLFGASLDSPLARFAFGATSSDLVITFAGRTEAVTITGYFDLTGAATLEKIVFGDNVVADARAIRDGVYANLATSGSDTLVGFVLPTTLVGGGGDDALTGRNGGDILIGGTGDDVLSGGGGDDTYRFGLGDGHDIVREYTSAFNGWGGLDTIELGAGIAPSDIVVSQADNGSDLVLTIAATGDSITLDDDVNGGDNRVEQVRFADGTVWTHADLMAIATAPTAGNDVTWGSSDGETLSGGAGDDTIDARGGADVLIGGAGNDLLSGSGGDDTYRFARGDGQDVIREYASAFSGWGGTDTIEFGAGIAPGDIVVSQANSGMDIVLAIAGTTDQITIDGGVGGGSDYRVEQVRFADGTVWSYSEILARSLGATSGNDALAGDTGANTIDGLAGNDTLEGRQGDDVLVGNVGDDDLSGGGGNDTYVFSRGDGADTIHDYDGGGSGSGGTDTVQFTAGIAPSDIVVTQAPGGADLVLAIAGTADRVTLVGTMGGNDYRIEQVQFADGTVWTHADLVAKSTVPTAGADTFYGSTDGEALSGGAGDDTIDGRQGDDILTGGTGNDLLSGSGGDDTYVFARGDGADTIREYVTGGSGWGGNDTIVFATGIAPADVTVSQANSGNDFVLSINGTSDRITIDNGIGGNGDYRVEQVHFADGTSWSYADLFARSLTGTAGNDAIFGDSADNTITGGAGDDTLDGGAGADRIIGGAGNDILKEGAGNDVYVWNLGDGDDHIQGGDGQDGWNAIEFGAGIAPANIRFAYAGTNGTGLQLSVAGQPGSITIDSYLSGGADERVDEVHFADGTVWSRAQLTGLALAQFSTAGNDSIWGAATADTITGGAGNDVIDPRGGNDVVTAGIGADRITESAGDDTYVWNLGDGEDRLEGAFSGDGFDTVQFGAGIAPTDIVYSYIGQDILIRVASMPGSLLLVGQRGTSNGIDQFKFADGTIWSSSYLYAHAPFDPTIYGSTSADTIYGTTGNDTFDGGLGNDTFRSGAGSDTYIYRSGDGSDYIDEESGSTTEVDRLRFLDINSGDVSLSRSGVHSLITIKATGEVITLDEQFYSATANWGIEQIVFANGEVWDRNRIQTESWIHGTSGADTIYGTSGNDSFDGGLGNDTFRSGAGSDTYIYRSGDGSDYIDEESGSTTEIDTLKFADLTANDVIFSKSGVHSLITVKATGAVITLDEQFFSATAYWGLEKIIFADGVTWGRSDILANSWIRGTAGADTLTGSAFDETFDGGTGNDMFRSGAGSDTYIYRSGDGSDYIDEESGSTSEVDTIKFLDLNSSDISLVKSGVHSLITVKATGDVITLDEQFYSTTAYWGLEKLVFANGEIWDRARIQLESWVKGTTGNDTLTGTATGDSLDGLAGNDTLQGSGGDDRLDGGAGTDTLTGGTGVDKFIFLPGDVGTGSAADRITDFVSGTDRIDLSGLDANSSLSGDQAFTFIGAGAFSGTAGELRSAWNGTDTIVQGDTDGDGIANFEIVLTGHITPVASDFLL
jgi:Ca2+-binding RTX toxin-like protein